MTLVLYSKQQPKFTFKPLRDITHPPSFANACPSKNAVCHEKRKKKPAETRRRQTQGLFEDGSIIINDSLEPTAHSQILAPRLLSSPRANSNHNSFFSTAPKQPTQHNTGAVAAMFCLLLSRLSCLADVDVNVGISCNFRFHARPHDFHRGYLTRWVTKDDK